MAKHTSTGRIGEEVACRYLENKGFSILERNWRFRKKEIDIIASYGGDIIFVEVKTRSSHSLISARNAVNRKKENNIIVAANGYIHQHNINLNARFDIIAIDIGADESYTIEHIQNAYYPHAKTKYSSV